MKRILAIFAFAFMAMALMAQDKVISIGGTTGVINSTTTTSRKTAAFSYVYQVDINAPIYYTYSIRLQDLGGVPKGNTASLILYGALENVSASYKQITAISLNVKAVPADTIIIGAITANPTTYKYYKWVITPSDTIWVEHLLMNIQPTVK